MARAEEEEEEGVSECHGGVQHSVTRTEYLVLWSQDKTRSDEEDWIDHSVEPSHRITPP